MERAEFPLHCLRLQPELRRYAWGDSHYLHDLFGPERVRQGPCAEAWYGAHATGSARTRVGSRNLPLAELLASRPDLAGAPDGQLPYLVKLLAAERPASIQVHPGVLQARQGFAREQADGLPLDAPERCFRDPMAKPELLIALDQVDALCGFEPVATLHARVQALPELAALLPQFDRPMESALQCALRSYFRADPDWRSAGLQRLLARCRRMEPAPWQARARWMLDVDAMLASELPDPGLIFFWLLALVRLQPSQALFIQPGTPHTYLRGRGVEVMANSDNVLRAGLTRKHVAAERLLETVRWTPPEVARINPEPAGSAFEIRYPLPVRDFSVRRLQVAPGSVWEGCAEGPETLLVMAEQAGEVVTLETPCGTDRLARGDACLLTPGSRYRLAGTGRGSAYLVSGPSNGA